MCHNLNLNVGEINIYRQKKLFSYDDVNENDVIIVNKDGGNTSKYPKVSP